MNGEKVMLHLNKRKVKKKEREKRKVIKRWLIKRLIMFNIKIKMAISNLLELLKS